LRSRSALEQDLFISEQDFVLEDAHGNRYSSQYTDSTGFVIMYLQYHYPELRADSGSMLFEVPTAALDQLRLTYAENWQGTSAATWRLPSFR
jgi:hypothetical protein